MPDLQSIRTRTTLAAIMLSLLVLTLLGVTTSMAVRSTSENQMLDRAEEVAGQWAAAARISPLPDPIPASGNVDLIQSVDADGRILAASTAARERPTLPQVRPSPEDRVERLRDASVALVAIRTTAEPDAPVVSAGLELPPYLRGYLLEYALGAAGLLLVGLIGWTSWTRMGQTLRPVAAVRTQLAQITVSDLSLRVPVPDGNDEIAMLVRTANQTLDRLDEAVTQQRRFASTTAHELRNPIAALRAELEDTLAHPDEVDQLGTVRSALSVTDRLEAIVGDLLVLAHLQADDPAPRDRLDLGALVTQEATHTEGMPVTVRAEPGVWVCGSRIQLIRVLGNLVANARRHAETGVQVFVSSTGDQAVVAVCDDGAGIAPADRDRVFERFVRLADGRRRDSSGSGLGLPISRDIAHGHGGTLEIEDSSRGARFVLRLPHADRQPADSGASGS
ncbi:hypothetical protein GCM10009555_070340 [Acrocarpospora macrocephala]|uniref:histidine kinase n=1 Tax=Acrocarpospora macrocephala TaxID=150177 RepID=A0A5M3WVW4_9ACTN|nr:HAMP domain-containing sensor histidine kinase [Acrocarpospora macrocephala]GES13054.1 hypothetical protein Amac_066510 [Acrocarpospora macrocephala]